MARKTELLQSKAIGEINLTPLMDLTFILLITFIITFPLLEQGLPVDLPKGEGEKIGEEETIPVTVDGKGGWFLEQREYTKEEFTLELRSMRQSRPNAIYLLRGDKTLPYGDLIEVMNVLKAEGVEKLSLVTQAGDGS